MEKNNIIGVYAIIGIEQDGHGSIIAVVNNEKNLASKVIEATRSCDYLLVTYYSVNVFGQVYVKPNDFDDFLFYYGEAKKYGLEIEYLQSILNGLAPIGAAIEWDL